MDKLFIYFFFHLLLLDLHGNVIKSLKISLLNDIELRLISKLINIILFGFFFFFFFFFSNTLLSCLS